MIKMLKSKTVWAGVGAVAAGVGMLLNGTYEQGIQLILEGLMAIFFRHAIRKGTGA